ncbi:hypothetical protein JW826_05080 [Candidatus Woesearchaeota archaeon]|nr:hypothetical protein [Candidatus Woesearchaeota archaeon]
MERKKRQDAGERKRSTNLMLVLLLIVIIPTSIIVLATIFDAGNYCTLGPNCDCSSEIAQCGGSYEVANNFNTIDSCQDGAAKSKYDFVNNIRTTDLNKSGQNTEYEGGDKIESEIQFRCYPGDFIVFAYTNYSNATTVNWTKIYGTTCTINGYATYFHNHTLDDREGWHGFRYIIAYQGSSSMTCAQSYPYSDNDDIALYVHAQPDSSPPTINSITPAEGENIEYSVGMTVNLIVNASDTAGVKNVTAKLEWTGETRYFNLSNASLAGGLFNVTMNNLTNLTRYNVTINATDNLNNSGLTTSYFFIVNNAFMNITSPSFGVTYPYTNVTLTFKIGDNLTPFQEVYYYLNGGNKTTLPLSVSVINNNSETVTMQHNNSLDNLSQSFITYESMEISELMLRAASGTPELFSTNILLRGGNSTNPNSTTYRNVTLNNSYEGNQSFSWANATFQTQFTLQPGTWYWITMAQANTTHFFSWEANLDGYSEGSCSANNSIDLLFKAIDIYKYSTIVNSTEGSNTIEVCERNSASNSDCSLTNYKADTNPPVLAVPTETSDPMEFGNTSSQFIRITVTDAVSSINTAVIETEGTNHTMDGLGGGQYEYRWDIYNTTEIGMHYYRIYANDSVDNRNNTRMYNFTVRDSLPPETTLLNYTPNTNSDLDPEVNISINYTISDYVQVTEARLQYATASNAAINNWTNVTMSNISSNFYSNFTPLDEGNWSFRAYAIDPYNNSVNTSMNNISVFYDRTWVFSPDEMETVFTTEGASVSLGNITINNTGDTQLNFTLAQTSGLPTVTITPNSITIGIADSQMINLSTTAPAQNPTPYPYSIDIACDTSGCESANETVYGYMMVGQGGPFITHSEFLYSYEVVQGDRSVPLNVTLKNIGNETAYNISVDWVLPTGWFSDDNVSAFFANMTPYATTFVTESHGIVGSVLLNATVGLQNLTVNIVYYTTVGAQRTYTITKTVDVVYPQDYEPPETGGGTTTTTGGGGGGGAGTGGGGIPPAPKSFNLTIDVPERITILRGQNRTIQVNLTNDNQAYFYDLTLRLEGYPTRRYSISPANISVLNPGETKAFNVYIDVPVYMGYSLNLLMLSFKGKSQERLNASKSSYEQTKTMTLIVSEIDESESAGCIAESEAFLLEMQAENFSTARVEALLAEAKDAFATLDYTLVKNNCEAIKTLKETSFELRQRMSSLLEEATNAQKEGYDMRNILRLLNISQEMFQTGEYEKALERVQRTEEAMALQVQTEDAKLGRRLARFLSKYWWAVIIFLGIMTYVSGIYYQKHVQQQIKDRLESLGNEEESITEVMKKLQEGYFAQKNVSTKVYDLTMQDYKNRLAEIENEKIDLKNKKVRMFKTDNTYEGLLVQKEEMLALVRELQENYFVNTKIDKSTYTRAFTTFKRKLAEIEKKIKVKKREIDTKEARKGEETAQAREAQTTRPTASHEPDKKNILEQRSEMNPKVKREKRPEGDEEKDDKKNKKKKRLSYLHKKLNE